MGKEALDGTCTRIRSAYARTLGNDDSSDLCELHGRYDGLGVCRAKNRHPDDHGGRTFGKQAFFVVPPIFQLRPLVARRAGIGDIRFDVAFLGKRRHVGAGRHAGAKA